MEEDQTTQELRLEQLRRVRAERELAERAPSEDEAEAHSRRAEKTAYLRERLEERARAEAADEGDATERSPRREP